MKKLEVLTCKLCGSNDIKRDGEWYYCTYCETRFRPDSVQTEKGDSPRDRFLILARRSKNNRDWESAKRYYDRVLEEDPFFWEAAFYVRYATILETINGEVAGEAFKMSNALDTILDLIKELPEEEQGTALEEVTSHVSSFSIFRCKVDSETIDKYKANSGIFNDAYHRLRNVFDLTESLGDKIASVFFENQLFCSEYAVKMWFVALKVHEQYIKQFTKEKYAKEDVSRLINRIRSIPHDASLDKEIEELHAKEKSREKYEELEEIINHSAGVPFAFFCCGILAALAGGYILYGRLKYGGDSFVLFFSIQLLIGSVVLFIYGANKKKKLQALINEKTRLQNNLKK